MDPTQALEISILGVIIMYNFILLLLGEGVFQILTLLRVGV